MFEWRTVKVGDLVKINISSYSKSDKWEFVNYLDTGSIIANAVGEIQRINLASEKLPSRAKRKVCLNDIVYSTVRPNQRHYGIIKSIPDNFLVSTGFAVLHCNQEKIIPDYLYFLLSQNDIVDSLHAIAEQSVSAYPSLKPSDIENLEITIPDLDIQKKIASVLMSITAKIEKNNEINKNLESQAKALYDKLIIQDMDDSWISGVLSDIATITMGQSPKGDTYNEEANGTVFFQGRAEFRFRFPTQRLYTTDPKRMSQRNDALMSVRAPVGDLNVAYEECCIGRGLAAIHSKDNHQSYVLYTMFALREQLNIFNGEGTVFGSINRDALNSLPIMIPPVSVIDAFEELVAPLDNMIRNNYDEICRLTSIRDSILPKLMSGELDISDIDL